MTHEQEILKQAIIKKIKAGKRLSHDEEIFNLTKLVGLPKYMAEKVIAINKNKNKDIILD